MKDFKNYEEKIIKDLNDKIDLLFYKINFETNRRDIFIYENVFYEVKNLIAEIEKLSCKVSDIQFYKKTNVTLQTIKGTIKINQEYYSCIDI